MTTKGLRLIQNVFIGMAGLLMVFFLSESITLIDIDEVVSPSVKNILLAIMLIGGILMLVNLIQQICQWERRTKPLPRLSYGALAILILIFILLLSIPIVATELLEERILVYVILFVCGSVAVLHRYFEIK